MTSSCIKLNAADNVAAALRDMSQGKTITVDGLTFTLLDNIPAAHKVAIADIDEGEPVLRYGSSIGRAKCDIKAGQHVHTHNLRSDMSDADNFKYTNTEMLAPASDIEDEIISFMGFRRPDGTVGVRNEIWIIPTVGCVNDIAEQLARRFESALPDSIDAIRSLRHPLGCSQLGGDHLRTRKLLAALARHPNAGGVLLLGLGCENNRLHELCNEIGDFDPRRIKMLNCQDCQDESEDAAILLEQLGEYVSSFKRQRCEISELVIGLKCGGSDGLSGVTANPLVGAVCDSLTQLGGSALLSETPEMFGAEKPLLTRCVDADTFNRCLKMINNFKNYYISRGMPIDENPSPGNIEGGITTLAEKSLGCVTKGGSAAIVDCLGYGESLTKRGLSLLDGPGNDIVATTNLIAAGAHIVLFTTGRGTPLSGPVPTIKIASNTALYERKGNWLDFNAGKLIEGENMNKLSQELLELVTETASGEYFTKAERHGRYSIAIFHDGVTL